MTSIVGGASGNFSSSGPEPFGIEDIDAFGVAASIASKGKLVAAEEQNETINGQQLKGVTVILRASRVETAAMVILASAHRLSQQDTTHARAKEPV